MRLVRTWPANIPPGRHYVVDDVPRLIVDAYDSTPIARLDEDTIVLEWDVAASPEMLADFRDWVNMDRSRVTAAPYRLYRYGPYAGHPKPASLPPGVGMGVWAHRRQVNPDSDTSGYRHVEVGENCHYFGFGMTYFPRDVVRAYMADRAAALADKPGEVDWRFSDGSFSAWHWRVVHREVPIPWHIRPVHLHYETRWRS